VVPELARSAVLAVAASWMAWLWWRRAAGLVAAFGSLYLALPSLALVLEATGAAVLALEPMEWASVAVTAALTGAMVWATRRAESPLSVALRIAERERAAAELRGRAYALAALVLADGR
jgi:hypothetical protein